MGFGWFLTILFWALIVLGAVALVKWLLPGQGPAGAGRGPLEILKERYARGEITREQYEQMRRDIES
jgi:putative membrane protein